MDEQLTRSITTQLTSVLVTMRKGMAKAMEIDRCNFVPISPVCAATQDVAEVKTQRSRRRCRRANKK